jgi:hypothetical protein
MNRCPAHSRKGTRQLRQSRASLSSGDSKGFLTLRDDCHTVVADRAAEEDFVPDLDLVEPDSHWQPDTDARGVDEDTVRRAVLDGLRIACHDVT